MYCHGDIVRTVKKLTDLNIICNVMAILNAKARLLTTWTTKKSDTIIRYVLHAPKENRKQKTKIHYSWSK